MITILKHDIIIRKDRIGIMPIGALSVAFVCYISGIDTFIESRKTHYSIGGKLKIYLGDEIKEIILTKENYTNNIASLVFTGLPEIILFSPPNHRLISTLDEVINMICKILDLINLKDDIAKYIPKFVMLSNGIYYDEVMSYITNVFRDIDENIREEIKGNFIRATTHQTGRIENKDSAVFKPGSKGSITIAGGSKRSRERIITLFSKFDYPISENGTDVRMIEFDKAIINLSGNGVQLSLLYDNEGKIHNYTLGDLVLDKKMQEVCKKIIYTMVSIGVKAGIYKSHNQHKQITAKNKYIHQKQLIETISQEFWEYIEEKSQKDNDHVFSSIATIIERYRRRRKSENKPVRIPHLEENIINYLINLSNENNLMEEKKIIEELRDSILRVCEKVWC